MPETAGGGCGNPPLIRKLIFRLLDWLRDNDRPRSVSFLERFSFKELKRATDGFQRVISNHSSSQGGTTTYGATLQDGSLALVREISRRANKEAVFKEIQLLGNLNHRHLVLLRGYSIGHRSFLVFESSGYGSLKDYLADPLKTPLSWKVRLQIALGIAAALEYLHFFCDPPVYSVSISASNIILDDKFTAKISNIRLVNSDSFPVDKDLIAQGHRQLVAQFGTLLLELITGQSSVSEEAIEWVQDSSQHIDQSMHRMIDPDLGYNYDSRVLRNLLAVGRLCITMGEEEKRQQRQPTFLISHVHRYLQEMIGVALVD